MFSTTFEPANRLVADALEADWNEKLRILKDVQEEYERQCKADLCVIDTEHRERILSLATDLPKLWASPNATARARTRIIRLILEDVTLVKGQEITAHVCFKGGATQTISIPRPLTAWETWKTSREIVAEIDRLLEQHTAREIASILNERGLVSGTNRAFTGDMVSGIQQQYGLKTRYKRLREAGLWTKHDLADMLGVAQGTVVAKVQIRANSEAHVQRSR